MPIARRRSPKSTDVTAPPLYLYLTTMGRRTGLPREIEIWFTERDSRYYVIAEHRERAHWVQNVIANPRVRVRLGQTTFEARARVLDAQRDAALYRAVQSASREKYGWGAGLPVELAPL